MSDLVIEPTENGVVIEPTETRAEVQAVDVYTTYHWLHPGQSLPEHQEVAT